MYCFVLELKSFWSKRAEVSKSTRLETAEGHVLEHPAHTRMQTLGHRGRVNEIPAAQTAGDVGVYVPEFNLSGQHLWLLQEKNAH